MAQDDFDQDHEDKGYDLKGLTRIRDTLGGINPFLEKTIYGLNIITEEKLRNYSELPDGELPSDRSESSGPYQGFDGKQYESQEALKMANAAWMRENIVINHNRIDIFFPDDLRKTDIGMEERRRLREIRYDPRLDKWQNALPRPGLGLIPEQQKALQDYLAKYQKG